MDGAIVNRVNNKWGLCRFVLLDDNTELFSNRFYNKNLASNKPLETCTEHFDRLNRLVEVLSKRGACGEPVELTGLRQAQPP